MKIRILSLAIPAVLALTAGPAMAQQGDKPEFRNPTVATPPDEAILKEASEVAKAAGGGKCDAVFTVTVEGKPKDIKPNCTTPALDAVVSRAIESMVYLPEIYRFEVFEAEGVKQSFSFATKTVTSKAPIAKTMIEKREITRMQDKVAKPGSCAIKLTVTAAGKAKDVVPNCTPTDYDQYVRAAVEKLTFEPATTDGKKVDWPNFELQITLGGKE